MDQPAGFTPTKCDRNPRRRRLMISQHLQMLSTCLFIARNFPVEELDTWTNMQWTTTHRPATRELKLTMKSTRSSQAKHRQYLAVLRGLIPKKQFELDPRRKTYQYP